MAQINYTDALLRFDDYITNNISEEDLIEKSVKASLMSKFHFYRLFKAVTGMTVNAYITERRLLGVVGDLIGEKTILQIAFDNGFNSNEVLTRNFKKSLSLTPAKFRKLDKSEQAIYLKEKAKAVKLDFRSLELDIVNKQGLIDVKSYQEVLESMLLIGKSRISTDLMVDTIPIFVEEVVSGLTHEDHLVEDAVYRICHSIDDSSIPPTFTEFVGVPTKTRLEISNNYEVFELETCQILKFTHKGKLFSENDIPVVNTYELIYKYRLPALNILLTDDYYIERYGNDFLGIDNPNSIITIMFSI